MGLSDTEKGRGRSSAVKAGPRIHSIAALPSGRDLKGRFNVSGSTYAFVYSPSSAEIAGRKLRLLGKFTVTDPAGRERGRDGVRAELAATQGGAGAGPPRRQILAVQGCAAEQKPASASRVLPRTDNTGATAFVGVMYLHLEPLDGARLGVPADLSRVQLNARLWSTDELPRNLQDVYSQLVEALYGEQLKADNARLLLAEL